MTAVIVGSPYIGYCFSMAKAEKIPLEAPFVDKLTGIVAGGVWGVLTSAGNLNGACIGVLPAITFRIKQYLTEFGSPISDTDVAVFARTTADRTEMVLDFFNLKLSNQSAVKKEIETVVRKGVTDFYKGKENLGK